MLGSDEEICRRRRRRHRGKGVETTCDDACSY